MEPCTAAMGAPAGSPIGANSAWAEADVTVRSGGLRGITIAGDSVVRMIDEFPAFAVVATQAEARPFRRSRAAREGVGSDWNAGRRVAQIGRADRRPGSFVIEGLTRLRGAVVDSHGDHRLAMSLAWRG
jgi:3-phosphoshikimate 1-carboxyvinyltransferase